MQPLPAHVKLELEDAFPALVDELKNLFTSPRVTVIVRNPENSDHDIVLTNEPDIADAAGVLQREPAPIIMPFHG